MITKKLNIHTNEFQRIYKIGNIEDEKAPNNGINELMKEMASKVDTISETLKAHHSQLDQHDGIIEIIANNANYIAENFQSMREFLQDLNQNKQIKSTKSIEEHSELVKSDYKKNNIVNNLTKPNTPKPFTTMAQSSFSAKLKQLTDSQKNPLS